MHDVSKKGKLSEGLIYCGDALGSFSETDYWPQSVYDAKVSIRTKLHLLQTIRSKLSWNGDRLVVLFQSCSGDLDLGDLDLGDLDLGDLDLSIILFSFTFEIFSYHHSLP
ncbi:hypothetical protein Tco_1150041 [Tanacetum coccineum]